MTANSCSWTDTRDDVFADVGDNRDGRLPVRSVAGGDLSFSVIGGRLARREDALRFRQDGRLRHPPRRGDGHCVG